MITLNGVPVDEPKSFDFVTEVLELFESDANVTIEPDAPPPDAEKINNQNKTPTVEQQSNNQSDSTLEFVYLTNKEVPLYLQQHPGRSLSKSGTKPRTLRSGPGQPSSQWRYRINCIRSNEVGEALGGPRAKMWQTAIESEYNSLISNQTWSLVPRTQHMKPVKSKWVLKLKLDEEVPKFKARLVARGFTQRADIDYFDTFSPVIRISSVRLLLSYALFKQMTIHHIDVKNAYLNAHLDEFIFMEQPDYFHEEDPKNFVSNFDVPSTDSSNPQNVGTNI